MPVATTLKELSFDTALGHLDKGAAFVDLRPSDEYLEVHIPGALDLVFEFGPGMSTRARDCIPLSVPLMLLEDESNDLRHAAASLRGKGFSVLGYVTDGVNAWVRSSHKPASTEVADGLQRPEGFILDVADPGARSPRDATRISTEELWQRSAEVAHENRIVITAGYGVRAALAVGVLELAGVREIVFWRTPKARR